MVKIAKGSPKKSLKEDIKKAKKETFRVSTHILVPEHKKISEKEKEELLDKYKITIAQLPRISMGDPGIEGMELDVDDVIKVTRPSKTAGTFVFYRRIVK